MCVNRVCPILIKLTFMKSSWKIIRNTYHPVKSDKIVLKVGTPTLNMTHHFLGLYLLYKVVKDNGILFSVKIISSPNGVHCINWILDKFSLTKYIQEQFYKSPALVLPTMPISYFRDSKGPFGQLALFSCCYRVSHSRFQLFK